MSLSKYILLTSFSAITMMHSTLSMEAQTKVTWSEEQKITSAASSYAYDITSNTIDTRENLPLSLSSYNVIKSRFATADEGTIQAVTLYDPKKNTAIISFRGTKEARDWKANLGIGYCIAQAIHTMDYKINEKHIRLPEYFANLAAHNIQGLFGEQYSKTLLDTLDLPLSRLLDSFVTLNPLVEKMYEAVSDTGKHILGGTTSGAAGGSTAGAFYFGVGALPGALMGAGVGLTYGCLKGAYNGVGMICEGYRIAKDYKYERELHLGSLSRFVDLNILQQYTSDAANFTRASIEAILSENTSDQDPTIYFTGHSLGRFLSVSAFLDCLGSRNIDETEIKLERIASMRNIGFNGPAGFQGLPHLSFMTGQPGQNVTTALKLLESDINRPLVQHIRRKNDVVGSLAAEFDYAQSHVIDNVAIVESFSASQHFLNNHGIKPIFQLFHQ
jgi:hypothetical protein